ncbi:MAG: xylulokinase [Alphaproteobacteria bacterium]
MAPGQAADGLTIGLDIGTSGAKGLLVDPTGSVVAEAGVEYPLLTPRPGWTEQDPEAWWQATLTILRRLAETAPRPPLALGLTGQMHGATFVDADGAAIRPALLWNDQRTGAECDRITDLLGAARLRAITGNPALTGFQAPKILWLRAHEPEAYARIARVLLPKDFIRHRLTGVAATDPSDAAGTLLLDLAARDWAPEILDALAIPRDWLPRVCEGPEITGRLSGAAAAATGLPEGLPVVAGGGDNAAAAVGSGVVREGRGLVSIGTSGVVFVHTDRPTVDPSGALHAFCHAVPGGYHLMGVVLSAGGALRWYRDVIGADTADGEDPYDAIQRTAAAAPAGCDGAVFLPYLAGERTPHMDPDARAAWVGLTLAHGRAHMARAVLEGVAFALRQSLERIAALGIPVDGLNAVGGGVRGDLWRAIIAAALDQPLQRLSAEQGPAYGAALLAAVGAGVHADVVAAADACVRPAGPAERPDTALRAAMDPAYRAFARLYPALRAARG